jgi:hypothetical protein
MPGGQGNRVVEEEQRRPPSRSGQLEPPTTELGEAGDPQRTAMVADDVLVVVDHAAAVTGEHAAGDRRVEVTPSVDTVAARHRASMPSPEDSAAE